ncbi:MAG TPA: hypothetical protein ENJ18_13740 [Nannocystis exedens]|nr:hypothetical protein [Nannocystis exedens]
MDSPIDLSRYIQRRHFRSFERDMARSSYGYGVDLRRTRWLTTSLVGQAPLRALEHSWYAVAGSLMQEELRVPELSGDIPLLSEVARIARLLRTVSPAIRILRPGIDVRREWGLVTPIGDPRGSNEWIVLDREALQKLSAPERAFLLGAGLGHLHCGHGALFLAHLVGHRRSGHSLLRGLLRPWIKVAVFSADRAGLLAAGDLEASLTALQRSIAAAPTWSPKFPDFDTRRLALEEFAWTTVAARFRARLRRESGEIDLEEELRSLASPPETDSDGTNDPDQDESLGVPDNKQDRRQDNKQDPVSGSDDNDGVPDDAWSLARCDHRLTTRLGLL